MEKDDPRADATAPAPKLRVWCEVRVARVKASTCCDEANTNARAHDAFMPGLPRPELSLDSPISFAGLLCSQDARSQYGAKGKCQTHAAKLARRVCGMTSVRGLHWFCLHLRFSACSNETSVFFISSGHMSPRVLLSFLSPPVAHTQEKSRHILPPSIRDKEAPYIQPTPTSSAVSIRHAYTSTRSAALLVGLYQETGSISSLSLPIPRNHGSRSIHRPV